MKKVMLVVLPLVGFAAPAAAEVPGGFRLEGMVGYERSRAKFADAATTARKTVNGVFYGVGIGFDSPMNADFAIGADAELTFSTSDTSSQSGEINFNKDFYVGGRATAGLTDRVSAYAKVGYTRLRLNFDAPNSAVAPAVAGNLNGVRGALGVKVASDDDTRTFFGIEGRYSDYEAGVNRKQVMLTVGTHF